MNTRTLPVMIVVTGLPASGKTTIARRIAAEFDLPLVTKDDIKERLFDSLGWSDREWSKRVGVASMGLLYYTVELLLTGGSSLVVESNFKPEYDTRRFLDLRNRHEFVPLVVYCRARGEILLERFRKRAEAGERHPGHVDQSNWREFEPILLDGDSQPLEIGGSTLDVDTSDFEAIAYPALFREVETILAANLLAC